MTRNILKYVCNTWRLVWISVFEISVCVGDLYLVIKCYSRFRSKLVFIAAVSAMHFQCPPWEGVGQLAAVRFMEAWWNGKRGYCAEIASAINNGGPRVVAKQMNYRPYLIKPPRIITPIGEMQSTGPVQTDVCICWMWLWIAAVVGDEWLSFIWIAEAEKWNEWTRQQLKKSRPWNKIGRCFFFLQTMESQ